MRGEWIEMLFNRKANATRSSIPMRGEWIVIIRAKLDLSEFASLPEYETIRQIIDEKLSREGVRHEFAPMPEGEHLVFMVEDAPAVNEVFKELEKTTSASTRRAEKELSQMCERIKGEPIAEKAAHAREASSRLEAAKGKSREISRGVETRAK